MRKLISIGLCLCITSPSLAAYSAGNHLSVGLGTNGGTTGALDTTGADLLIVVTDDYFFYSPGTLSDSQSNTWTMLTQTVGPGETAVTIWYASDATVNASHTFTYTGSSLYVGIAVMAFSGSLTSSDPFDVQNGAGVSAGTALNITGSGTPSENNELEIAMLGLSVGASAASIAVVTGYTIAENLAYQTAVNEGVTLAYKIQTSASAPNPSWSWTGAASGGARVATFKAAPGGQTTPVCPSPFCGIIQ